MLDKIESETEKRMDQTVEAIRKELSSIRTGRASLHILDGVEVEAYGSKVPLNQVAGLHVQDAQLLTVKPYDQNVLGDIEKAILTADLGLNPVNDGKMLKIPIPPLTEERRKEIAKRVGEIREEGKVSLRNIRHDAREQIKQAQQDKEISEDDEHRAYDIIQKMTDGHAEKIEKLADAKEKEILEM